MAKRRKSRRFVGRGGEKLEGALEAFGIDVAGRVAADLGANVGGFTDCLLQRSARRVYAVDTAYGVFEWKLRQNCRVVVLERTNALHVALPEPVDLVAVDVGWTRLGLMLPHAVSQLGVGGKVVALLKPQYEAEEQERQGGVVLPESVDGVIARVVKRLEDSGIGVSRQAASSLRGSGGNAEFFLLVEPRSGG